MIWILKINEQDQKYRFLNREDKTNEDENEPDSKRKEISGAPKY